MQPVQQLWNMGDPGLKILCYKIINAGLLPANISRKSWEVYQSNVQDTTAEKVFDNSQWSDSWDNAHS